MVEVDVTGVAAGGDGVARLDDGRAVFVRGGLPGERVRIRIDDEKTSFARATATSVVAPSAARRDPPCSHVAEGCGGCGWQHVAPAAQRELKRAIVVDALTRIGRLDPASLPPIDDGPDLPALGYRTTVQAAAGPDGSLGLRAHHGHDVVPFGAAGCLVAHPLVNDVLRAIRCPGASEVTVRCGAATGERLIVVDPSRAGIDGVPDGVAVVGGDELGGGVRAWLHEDVAGRRWRVSARSFFQSRPDGAEALVDAVHDAVAPAAPAQVVDLYAGVGLFAGALADRLGCRVVAVEANRSSVADARANLADLPAAKVVAADVRRWRPSPVDAVVADPSRHGLGRAVVDRVVGTGARIVALVSCDPGSLGRDAGLLAAAGYRLGAATVIDLFPHTPHVEVVTAWRADRNPRRRAAS